MCVNKRANLIFDHRHGSAEYRIEGQDDEVTCEMGPSSRMYPESVTFCCVHPLPSGCPTGSTRPPAGPASRSQLPALTDRGAVNNCVQSLCRQCFYLSWVDT